MIKLVMIYLLISITPFALLSQTVGIPKDRIISDSELVGLINDKLANYDTVNVKNIIAEYFKEKFSDRYFNNWKEFKNRFIQYQELYPDEKNDHYRRAKEHMGLFEASTNWKLPFTGKKGEPITAYQLRHLARQHKTENIAFVYYYENENPEYLRYFIEQVKSLNKKYFAGDVESGGNDVFEYFRSGYRIFNWLNVHNMFLASDLYTSEDQVLLIKTFLYHGAIMFERTKKFSSGNHHTKGLMSLALLSILFKDIKGTDAWLKQSVEGLNRHLREEINPDGFQFERSVHYHIGDIDNYFYVYRLAKLNGIAIPDEYTVRFKSMFNALLQLAQPGKTLPVLQDDTDQPFAEFNSLGSVMKLGSLLFDEFNIIYFSDSKLSSSYYWFFNEEDIQKNISDNITAPSLSSTELKETGYYIMRNGWNKDSYYAIISAGLSDVKPDHQHGDMLGITAFANQNYILPNYQVRYFLEDYRFFKNSYVKNVAVVDSIPQGLNWKANEGGSGFGKWNTLPVPQTLLWETNDLYDIYMGGHDGYKFINVDYGRKVIFIKDGFWIVKDEFYSDELHNYQQIWQGHYSEAADARHLQSTFSNGSGLDIIQLNDTEYKIDMGSARGKGNAVINSGGKDKYHFLTLLYPFGHFEDRFTAQTDSSFYLKGWLFKRNDYRNNKYKIAVDCQYSISKNNLMFLFDCNSFSFANNKISADIPTDVILKIDAGDCTATFLNGKEIVLKFTGENEIEINDSVITDLNNFAIKPGSKMKIKKNLK